MLRAEFPRGSALAPLLFLDNGLKSTVYKFVNDTKLCGIANSHPKQLDIQEDLNILDQWSEKWANEISPK